MERPAEDAPMRGRSDQAPPRVDARRLVSGRRKLRRRLACESDEHCSNHPTANTCHCWFLSLTRAARFTAHSTSTCGDIRSSARWCAGE
jgi:hypothetical protein